MDPFLGEIKMVGFSFAPSGFAFCQAQLMPISQNTALFALLGTTFGGDGVQTYGLPDYRSRIPVGMGTGPRLAPIDQGEISGTENVTLISSQMPTHVHAATAAVAIKASSSAASLDTPNNTSFFGVVTDLNRGGADIGIYATGTPDSTLQPFNATMTNPAAGGNQPFNVSNPFLGTNFIIALNGVFPSRN